MGGRSWGAGGGDDDASGSRGGGAEPRQTTPRTATRWSAQTRISRPGDDREAADAGRREDIDATRVRPPDDVDVTRISGPDVDDLESTRAAPEDIDETRVRPPDDVDVTRVSAPEDVEATRISSGRSAAGVSASGPRSRKELRDLLATPTPTPQTFRRRAALSASDLRSRDLGGDALESLTAGGAAPPDEGELPSHIGRYMILRILGRGGMGVVYSAYDERLDRKVAIKLLRDPDAGEEAYQRLHREAQALARLSDPHVVTIHEVGLHEDAIYIVMEFVTGLTLREWLAVTPRSQAEILAVMIQAGEGLAAAHAAGLVHRDVKPENLIVGDDGRVKVFDFGLARTVDAPASDGAAAEAPAQRSGPRPVDDLPHPSLSTLEHDMTITGTLLGTPAYMAPEQHLRLATDERTDVFAFALVLYEALTGERPFPGETYDDLRRSVTMGKMRAPPEGTLAPWLLRVLRRGLTPDLDARWPTMDALLAALADDPLARRRRWLRWGAALTLAIACAAALPLGIAELRGRWAHEARERAAAARWERVLAELEALRADGLEVEADAAFGAFADAPEQRGTEALSEAWLARGRAFAEADDDGRAMAAFANAYTAAPTADLERRTLMAIAAILRARHELRALVPLADALGDPGDDPELAALKIDVAAFRRDFAEAASLAAEHPERDAAAPLFTALDRARSLGPTHPRRAFVDIDGDGRDERVILDSKSGTGARLEVVRVGGSAAPQTLRLPKAQTAAKLSSAAPLIFAHGDAGVRHLYSFTGGELVERWRGELAAEPHEWLLGPADDRGHQPLYVALNAYRRGLFVIDLPPPGRVGEAPARIAHQATDAAHSDVQALRYADVDGDGEVELIANVGPWRAYDLRVFRPRGGALELIERIDVGNTVASAPVSGPGGASLLAYAKDDRWPNRTLFPEPPHRGPAPGIYLLRADEAGLRAAGHLAVQPSGSQELLRVESFASGDLDGDGLSDVVASIDGDARTPVTLLFHQTASGAFVPYFIGDAARPAIVESDGDPAAELVLLIDGADWVLGHDPSDRYSEGGDGREAAALPTLSRVTPLAQPPPPALDEAPLRERWRRAERLAALGLTAVAGGAFLDLGRLIRDTELRALAEARAAELFAHADELRRSVRILDRVAGPPAIRAAAARGAASYRARLGELEDAAGRWLAADGARRPIDPEAVAPFSQRELEAVADPQRAVKIRFDRPLDPAWTIGESAVASRDPLRESLVIDAGDGAETWLSLPLEWDGGPLIVTVDLEVERLLFGGAIAVGLRTADGERGLRAAVQTIGGSGVYARDRWCGGKIVHSAPDVAADHHERMTITLAYSPVKGAQRCTFAAADAIDGETARRETPLSGALVLDLGAFSRPSSQPLHARVRLHGVDLVGVRPAAATSADLAARGRWQLAEGRAEESSELFAQLPEPSPRDRVYQALAWIRRGRWEEAEAAVAPLADLDDEALDPIVPLVTVAAPSLTPLLQPLLGRRFARLALGATLISLLQHGDERFGRELYLEHTPWLGDVEIHGTTERWLKISLLSRRAAIYREIGDLRRAREDLDAALAVARDEIASGDLSVGPGDSPINRLLFALVGIYSQQAELYADDGDLEAARATLARAIAYSPTPELSAARLAERPQLTPLLDELGLLRSASASDDPAR